VKTILIIEDEEPLRLMLAELLAQGGFATLAAAGGLQGLRLARAHQPDLVLCDIRMPGMDGHEVLAELRRTPGLELLPVVIMTGHAALPDMRRSMTLGADDYLAKPFENSELLRVVHQHLQRAEQRRQEAGRELDSLRRNFGQLLPQHFVAPLHDIIGCASVLAVDAAVMPATEVREFAQSIHDAAERLHRQIENFLLYTGLDTGSVIAGPEPAYALDRLVRTTAEAAARRHRKLDSLHLSLQPAQTSVSREHLTKAIAEVLDNAFRHTPAGTRVEVNLQSDATGCQLVVRDEGDGVPPEMAAATAPVSLTSSRPRAGAGLGLYLSRRLTQLVGGGWELETKPHRGTTVTFTWARGEAATF
jgi:two-component system, sensor histidine kinase and response regulator